MEGIRIEGAEAIVVNIKPLVKSGNPILDENSIAFLKMRDEKGG